MPDLDFSYDLLQQLIDTFKTSHRSMEQLAGSLAPSSASEDPVAAHHAETVKAEEEKLLVDASTSLSNAQEGAQITYDTFKEADGTSKPGPVGTLGAVAAQTQKS